MCLQAFPILLGEMDPNGNLTAQCIHAFTPKTRSRLVAQVSKASINSGRSILALSLVSHIVAIVFMLL